MPLSPTERSYLINQMYDQIGNYDGYEDVWFGGYGFSAPSRIYHWFRSLPIRFQLRILQYVGTRQTEVVSNENRGEEPYNFGSGTNRRLYVAQLTNTTPETMTSFHAVVTTAEAVFNPQEAQRWKREGGGLLGLWNYYKVYRFPTNAQGSNIYEKLHNWLKDLLPRLYCDYVDEIEPRDEPVVRQITVPSLVYYVSWGDINTQQDKFVQVMLYPTASPNAIDNLRSKFASYSPTTRRNKLQQLFNNATKNTAFQQYQSQQGNMGFRYDLSSHSWIRRTDSISETILLRYEVKNYMTQSTANTIIS